MNFSLAPRKILVEGIICDIEFWIRDLPDNTKDTIEEDCVVILRKAKSPKNNHSKLEFDDLKALNNYKDIIVIKEDKVQAL